MKTGFFGLCVISITIIGLVIIISLITFLKDIFGILKETIINFKDNRKLTRRVRKIKIGNIYEDNDYKTYSRILDITDNSKIVKYRSGRAGGTVVCESLISFLINHDINPISLRTPTSGDVYIHSSTGIKAIIDKIVGDKIYYYAVDDLNYKGDEEDISYHHEVLSVFELCWRLEEQIR